MYRVRSLLLIAVIASVNLLSGCQTTQTVVTQQGGSNQRIADGKPGTVDERFDIRLRLAAAYMQGGSYEVAMTEVNRALELKSRSSEAIALKGMIYSQMGDIDQAVVNLKKAVAIDSNNGDLYHNLGALLCTYDRGLEGVAYLEKAATMPNNSDVAKSWLVIGDCYRKAGNIQKAETAYHQVLYLDPFNSMGLGRMAAILYNHYNDPIGAQDYLNRIGSTNAMDAATLWLGVKLARDRGDAYLMGQYAKSLRDRFPSSEEAAALNRGDYDS